MERISNRWRKKLKKKKRSIEKCETICINSDLEFVGTSAKCKCTKDNGCNWINPVGNCQHKQRCILPQIQNASNITCSTNGAYSTGVTRLNKIVFRDSSSRTGWQFL